MKAITKVLVIALVFVTATAAIAGADKKQTQKPDEGRRARGLFVTKKSDAMSIVVLKNDGGTLVPVDPSTEFKAGDQIKLQLQSNFEGYIYVVNIAPSGKRCVLFPYAQTSNNAVTPDERYDIPPPGDVIEFDQEKGTEVLQVIMSRDRIAYLDTALKETDKCLSESASSAAAELQAGVVKKVTPVVPQAQSTIRARDIILAAGKDKDASGTVVAISDNGGNGKLKAGEFAPVEIRLKHK